jgi:adenosylcobinamide-GDP ribazoletransferase
MKPFFAAVLFLTKLPLPCKWGGDETDLARSAVYFPVVGLAIGGVVVLLDVVVCAVLPFPMVNSLLTVLALVAVSGALHLDGLADTADGVFSSRPRDRVLEIMRDSQIGTMGALLLVGVLALKWAALSELTESLRWQCLLLMPLAGRCALVTQLAVLPYARPEGGLASLFANQVKASHAAWALLFLLAVSWSALAGAGLLVSLAALVGIAFLCAYFRQKLGGLTGDTLGATCELVEAIPLLVVLAWTGGTP